MKGLCVSDLPGPAAAIPRAEGAQIPPFLLSLTSSRRQEKFSSDAGGRGGYVPGKQGDCCAQRRPCGSRSGSRSQRTWWGWGSPCSTARWKLLKSVASRAQLYITKAPLFVPFVEMLLFSRSRVI